MSSPNALGVKNKDLTPHTHIGEYFTMLLLHISDIHFKGPLCKTRYDPDRPFRTMMVQDVKAHVKTLGPVDAILVTGDIANRANPEEYTAAFKWLMELAEAGGCPCPQEQIFVVPGNHDIDRSIITKRPAVKNVQHAITAASNANRERVLLEQFSDETTGRSLFEPLAAYNDFAKVFNCQVYTPDQLYWQQDLQLEEGIVLRLHGLTSTLLSGAVQESGSQDDIKGVLYLSPLQTVLDPAEGVINLVMFHHPPDWLLDQDEVEDAVQGRATLHLFGHKHRQRIQRDHYMRFSAGAVNPNRQELGWEPGYNLINLSVLEGEENKMSLNIEAHILKWQTNPDRFVPKLDNDGENIFRHTMRIANRSTIKATGISAAETVQPLPLKVDAETEVTVEVVMSNQSTRNLVRRFWNLSSSQRREIMLLLGLIEDADMKISEPERYGRALLRAGEQGLLEQLGQEIEQREKY